MTPEQFVYWLQGYAELTECAELTAKQWDMVKAKLADVARKDAACRPVLTPIGKAGW